MTGLHKKTQPDFKKILTATLIGLLLLFWVWMLIDLALNPTAGHANGSGAIFRWLSALTGIGTVVTALFILRRTTQTRIGTLLLLWGIGATGWSLRADWVSVQAGVAANSLFAFIFFCISIPAALLLLFIFPDGKPYPRWLDRWLPLLTGILAVSGLFYLFGLDPQYVQGNLPNPFLIPALAGTGMLIFIATFFITMTIALVTLILRYRHGEEKARMQIRWMAWLLGVGILLSYLKEIFVPQNNITISVVGWIFWQSFVTIGIGVAILRHRLWDIDFFIRKTLVYGVLTVLLGLIYFGLVTVLQNLLAGISNQQSPLAIVISTLAIAALFNPLRTRLQAFLDRRFYRSKYNAEQALNSFAQFSRTETDIAALTGELANVTENTLQPAFTSIWMKDEARRVRAEGREA